MSYNTHYSPFTKYGFCTVSFLAGVHQAKRSAQVCATNPRFAVLASGRHPYGIRTTPQTREQRTAGSVDGLRRQYVDEEQHLAAEFVVHIQRGCSHEQRR